MSELIDKQLNVQIESLKKLPGFTQAPASPQKMCAIKMKKEKTTQYRVIIFVVKRRTL